MRLLVVFSSRPWTLRFDPSSTTIAAHPPGPGFPTQEPSVYIEIIG